MGSHFLTNTDDTTTQRDAQLEPPRCLGQSTSVDASRLLMSESQSPLPTAAAAGLRRAKATATATFRGCAHAPRFRARRHATSSNNRSSGSSREAQFLRQRPCLDLCL